jgi:hypothetical protein
VTGAITDGPPEPPSSHGAVAGAVADAAGEPAKNDGPPDISA